MKDSTKKAFLRLKALASQAGRNLFERVKLAAEVLFDHEWIAEVHDGDQDRAAEAVRSEFFADLGDYVPMMKIVAIYREFPEESEWRRLRYNLQAMEVLFDEQRRSVADQESRRPVNRVRKADYDKLQEEVEQLRYVEKRERDENELLRQRVRELEAEVARLRGRLEAYEKLQLQVA